jgi:hypothetical protein
LVIVSAVALTSSPLTVSTFAPAFRPVTTPRMRPSARVAKAAVISVPLTSAFSPAVVAPVGTPEAIVHQASDALRAVLVRPEVKDKFAARTASVHPASPAEAEAFVRSQQELWKPALELLAQQAK